MNNHQSQALQYLAVLLSDTTTIPIMLLKVLLLFWKISNAGKADYLIAENYGWMLNSEYQQLRDLSHKKALIHQRDDLTQSG